ncbi:DgyrCDS12479 [Dimorphilus gyrociliatus]|uniref:DgyrCDS12479 n=1 Tax=Dimorphilus gyrociliatus TaxID=2664684 RepID=A0A7I8W6K8_9ANNE|nr:DgyrCDS12479 [Dimorphilus gyrociliatus]
MDAIKFCIILFVPLANSWQVGPWSDCKGVRCGSGGIRTRKVWCNNQNCNKKLQPVSQKSCFKICSELEPLLYWQTSEWSDCRSTECKSFRQTRTAQCRLKCQKSHVPEEICTKFYKKPKLTRLCRNECPTDCVVSEFGNWSKCDVYDTSLLKNITRWRVVLVEPKFGGKDCPTLEETKRCFNYSKSVTMMNYKYRYGEWSECKQIGNKNFGQQTRSYECIDYTGSKVDIGHCSNHREIRSSKYCHLDNDCHLSSWSSWFIAETRDHFFRKRSILEMGSGKKKCGKLEQKRLITDEDITDGCGKYKWISGAWSKCQLILPTDRCGNGLQTRSILCVRASDEHPVLKKSCKSIEPVHVKLCKVECIDDCILSSWSTWGPCRGSCGIKLRHRQHSRYQKRVRNVIREGINCPHRIETRPCKDTRCYSWKVLFEDECKASDRNEHGERCGFGYRNRTIQCVDSMGLIAISRDRCQLSPPPTTVTCQVPCNNDCVFSNWSEWSKCDDSCSNSYRPTLRQRTREILSFSSANGKKCPSHLLQEKKECESKCRTYRWRVNQWKKCIPLDKTRLCGEGYQTRNAYCENDLNEKLTEKGAARLCVQELRPVLQQNCTIPCPKDCLVSKFTMWTKCSLTCRSSRDRRLALQYRFKIVLQPPTLGGKRCSKVMNETQVCRNVPNCEDYRWVTSDFSKCLFPHGHVKCGLGLRTRKVECKSRSGGLRSDAVCKKELGPAPSRTESCFIHCYHHCKISSWSTWSSCTHRCGGHKVRRRQLESGNDKCKKIYALKETKTCSCMPFSTEGHGLWSNCIKEWSKKPKGESSDFGDFVEPSSEDPYELHKKEYFTLFKQTSCIVGHSGRRSRTLKCIDNVRQLSASSIMCSKTGLEDEMCFINCPSDCIMSEWSAWSSCRNDKCGISHQRRYRYLDSEDFGGGRPCPIPKNQTREYQTKPCYTECVYNWVPEPWSKCQNVGNSCGRFNKGTKTRKIKCIYSVNGTEVDASKCDPEEVPIHREQCTLACPEECVLSLWSEWTICLPPCSSRKMRTRHRSILRHGKFGDCGERINTEPCEVSNCGVYKWKWSEFSSCILGKHQCGIGKKIRVKECVKTGTEKSVPYSQCIKYGAINLKGEAMQSCHVPCPLDCVVSEWSEWSDCSKTCGYAQKFRKRRVLFEAKHLGRACPTPLVQQKPCAFTECHRWAWSSWTSCKNDVDSCGSGMQSRYLRCESTDGKLLHDAFCPKKPNLLRLGQEHRECYKPCPTDCVLSEWSSWGFCYRKCSHEDLAGVQTRSRIVLKSASKDGRPCSTSRVQSRKCIAQTCTLFKWRTSPWLRNDTRKVWCQTNHGDNVVNGCSFASRPPGIKECNPPCTVKHSYCKDTNECACMPGYFIQYSLHRTIANCSPPSSNFSKNAIDTESEENSPVNVWMFMVIGIGLFVVTSVFATLYFICKRGKEKKKAIYNRNNSLLSHQPSMKAPSTATNNTYSSSGIMSTTQPSSCSASTKQ